MFESLYEKRDNRSRRLLLLLAGAFALHAIALAVVLIVDFLRVSPVPQPAITITLLDAATLAPPPPPPPPPKKPKPKTVQKKVEPPKEMLAPKEIPKEIPKDEPSDGAGDGAGGVEGGVAGGVAGGIAPPAPPPKPPPAPPPPPKPVFRTTDDAKRERISGSDPVYPQRAQIQGWEGTLVVRIHIAPSGAVERLEFVKTDENFEETVRKAILSWRFKPRYIDGKAVSSYTVWRFVFKLQ